ncbi:hypothetical protein PoB_001798400 [Plakobranchus ocellatus]|uniref:Uncharacterized protein n=1 Tax=Plakobranchus ocellatus TaxID=259542 RepID=A0AAV3ZC19_9GAST|nr:hypothetical protein PoB_001798400 [Plakobranchus ocellatus]
MFSNFHALQHARAPVAGLKAAHPRQKGPSSSQGGFVVHCATDAQSSPQQGDLKLLGPPSDRGADGGARTRDRRVPADLRVGSQATVPKE